MNTREIPNRDPTHPGLYPGIDRATYFRIPAVSQSMLKGFTRTPAHAKYAIDNPKPETDSMRLGTLLHCYLLEPDRFLHRYVELPDLADGLTDDKGQPYAAPKQTEKYKAKLSEFGQLNLGKLFVAEEEMEICRGIGEAVAAHSTAAALLCSPGETELGVVWQDAETGLVCKALVDRLCTLNGERIIVDLKTTEDAGPAAFARSAATLGFHLQTYWYQAAMKAVGPGVHRFVHVVCETVPPYAVACYELDIDSQDQGYREARQYLRRYAECLGSGRWPAYPDAIEASRLPRWSMTEETS